MDPNTSVQQLRELVQKFVEERDWQRYHNLKNLSMALAIEVAELMEYTQWLTTEETERLDLAGNRAVAEEVADILCYTLAIANALRIDLSTAVLQKLEKNRQKYPKELRLNPVERLALEEGNEP